MPGREEIREGIENIRKEALGDEAIYLTDAFLNYLHSHGVVIKVDRELPQHLMEGQIACDKATYQEMLRRAGYVAVESLVKE